MDYEKYHKESLNILSDYKYYEKNQIRSISRSTDKVQSDNK